MAGIVGDAVAVMGIGERRADFAPVKSIIRFKLQAPAAAVRDITPFVGIIAKVHALVGRIHQRSADLLLRAKAVQSFEQPGFRAAPLFLPAAENTVVFGNGRLRARVAGQQCGVFAQGLVQAQVVAVFDKTRLHVVFGIGRFKFVAVLVLAQMKVRPTAAGGAPAHLPAGTLGIGVFQAGVNHAAAKARIFRRRVAVVHRHVFEQRRIHLKGFGRARGEKEMVAGFKLLFGRGVAAVGRARIHNVVGRQAVEQKQIVVIRLAVETHQLGGDFAGVGRFVGGIGKLHARMVAQKLGNGAVACRPAGDIVCLQIQRRAFFLRGTHPHHRQRA